MLTVTATNLPRVMACNGSRLMSPSVPPQLSDPTEREEGNAAHWLAQAIFTGAIDINACVGHKAPNGYFITEAMAAHVATYLSALHCGEMEVETSFGTDVYRVSARCDHRRWDERTRHLFIDDFKYGWRLVEPQNNWTLIAHAIGTVQIMQIIPERIILAIHQPRPYHRDGNYRFWSITYAELQQLWAQIDHTLRNPSDTLVTGPQCGKCHALATCPAAQAAGMNAVDTTSAVFTDDIADTALAYELDTLRNASATLKNRLEALEELATYRVQLGQAVALPNGDHYALEHKSGHRAWKPGITPAAIKAVSGVDIAKPGLATPAEAERRGLAKSVIDKLTERPNTGIKLVRRTSGDLDRIFKGVTK